MTEPATHTNFYKTCIERWYQLEVDHDLFDLQTDDGIRYWDLVRYDVMARMMELKGISPLVSAQHPPAVPSVRKNRLKALLLLPIVILHELFHRRKKRAVVLLNNSRTKTAAGFEDVLSQDIKTVIGADAFQLEMYTSSRWEVIRFRNRHKYFLVRLDWLKWWKQPVGERTVFPDFGFFEQEVDAPLFIPEVIALALHNYRIERAFFHRLLRKTAAKTLFLQSLPKSLIAAANELGIVTCDLQHGHINEFDPLYGYHRSVDTQQIPTAIRHYLTVGAYWEQFVHPTMSCTTVGSSYFFPPERQPGTNGILLISNRFVHEALLEQVLHCAPQLPNERFFYKMHSNQVDQYADTVQRLSHLDNVFVHIFNDVNGLLEDSKLVVLVQSTVAYQALQMGIQVAIYRAFYYEASADLFGKEGVHLLDSPEELIAIIQSVNEQCIATDYAFFDSFQPAALAPFYKTPKIR
jgi:hypothetical protein